jgi:GT2 family glycosyltransferase
MSSETWMPIGFIPSVSFLRNTINSCSAIFRRSVFDKAGYYDEEMISYEDWEFYLRLHLQGFQGDIIPETYLHYRVKSQSSSMLQGTGIPKSKVITQYILKKHERSLNKETFSLISQLLIDLWKREEIDKCNADSWYRGEIARLEDRICGLEATEARLAQRIKAMESSKVWRSRLFWFNLKRKLGLSQEEP